MAAEAGFAVQVNAMEFGTALQTVQRGDYVMTLGGWSGLLDTDSNAWSFLHTGGALNRPATPIRGWMRYWIRLAR